MIVHHDQEFKIEKLGPWVVVNGRFHGFYMRTDESEPMIVCHPRRQGWFAREAGFYIPSPLVMIPHMFEVRTKTTCYQYIYRPDKAQRFFNTPPLIFFSVAKMEFIKDAQPITRPKKPGR